MRKLRSRRGFSLTEMLMAVLLLVFVSSMATVMTSAVLNGTAAMQSTAQAEILGNEALTNIQNELRRAHSVRFLQDAGEVTGVEYESTETSKFKTFALNEEGRIVVGQTAEIAEKNDLLFGAVSYMNLRIRSLTFEEAADGGVKIALSVADSRGRVLWSGDTVVWPLSGVATIS